MSFLSKAFTAAALAGAVLACPLSASAGAYLTSWSKATSGDPAPTIGAAMTPDRPLAPIPATGDAHDLFAALDARTGVRSRAADRFSPEPLRTSVDIDGVNYAVLSPASVMAATPPGSRTSRLPEPATWAMMMLGFGGAGALMRRHRHGGGHTYRLVEMLPGGDERSEEFGAPDDATALARATLVAEGRIEVYRGNMRVMPQA